MPKNTDRLIAALNLLHVRSYTAGELARALNVSEMTASTLIKTLRRRGFRLDVEDKQVGARGPAARAYKLDTK